MIRLPTTVMPVLGGVVAGMTATVKSVVAGGEMLVGFACILASLALYGEELFDGVSSYTKLSVGLVDTNRLQIWDHYMAQINPYTFFMGADYAGTVIEYEYRRNPHIAYIRTHSFFGLPVTVLAILSPMLVLFASKAMSAKLVFLAFISLAALRATSEPLFFPTLLDLFYFSYFFVYLNHAPASAAQPPQRPSTEVVGVA